MKQRTDIAFPMSEYERRLALVRAGMQRRELDALLVTTPENITYLTGFESPGHYWFQALVVPAQGEPFTVSRLLETSGVDAYSWIEHNLAYSDDDDQMAVLAARLTDFDLAGATVGFEKECWFFTAAQQEQLFANLPGARFVDASGTVEACRLIKSELEVDMIRQAARTTEAGMRAGIAAVVEGATENDVAADISYAMIKAGSEWPSIVPFVASGERGAIGHATWRERVLQRGDSVFLEVAGCRRRYHAPMMRTCVVGPPAPELAAAFQVWSSTRSRLAWKPFARARWRPTWTRRRGLWWQVPASAARRRRAWRTPWASPCRPPGARGTSLASSRARSARCRPT